jgi:hypothetical protein
MSRMVIELLLGQMTGSELPHGELFFEPELVVRSSTGPAPVAPPAQDASDLTATATGGR